MSGADDLRADDLIDDLIRAVMDHTHGREGVLDRKGAEKDLREYVADPERRMAIFDAMGLDVVRSPYHDCHLGEGPVVTNCQTPVGSCACNERNALYVVRPRGEATACTHRGRVRDSDDETVCLECDRRFSSMDALARDGGWDLSDPGREATDA